MQKFWTFIDFLQTYNGAVTAVSTVIIAIFTAVLGVFTVRLARATKIAADAAKLSADAALAAESARILILPISHNYWTAAGQYAALFPNSPQMGRLSTKITVDLTFRNYGRTPGSLIAMGAALASEARPPPIVSPPKQRRFNAGLPELPLPVKSVLTQGEDTEVIRIDLPDLLEMSDAVAISNGQKSIWLYGYLIYSDVFERECEERFAFRLRPDKSGGFSRYYDRTYYRPQEG